MISSSLGMIQGKNKAMVSKVFEFFAVFPEDAPVPASFFSKLAPYLSGMKTSNARLSIGKCLSTISKCSLLTNHQFEYSLWPLVHCFSQNALASDTFILAHISKEASAFPETSV